jgi:hypothetical protein
MDPTTRKTLEIWKAQLSNKERRLYELAAVKLKKTLVVGPEDKDNGSFFPEYCHGFLSWKKSQAK